MAAAFEDKYIMNTDVARAIAIRASVIHKENRFNINVMNKLQKKTKKK